MKEIDKTLEAIFKAQKKEISLFEVGMYGIIMGVVSGGLGAIGPAIWLNVAGFGSVTYHMITKDTSRYTKLWKNCGLVNRDEKYPKLVNKRDTKFGYDLAFSLPVGLSTKEFEYKKEAIEQFIGNKIRIIYANNNVILSVYEKELNSNYEYKSVETKNVLELVIGYSFGDKIETVDLSDGSPHMLVAGETGSGKSTLIRSIITNIVLTKNPKQLELYLVDLKRGAEFNIFKNCKIVKSFSITNKEAEDMLYKLSNEVDRRYNLFAEKDCVDIIEYNEKFKKNKLKYKLVIIDEFADLQDEKGSLSVIEELARKARACGIHLILATQRPDAKVLNGRIKANVPVVIGLKTMNELNSRIILDSGGAEMLRGKGHGLLRYKKMIEFQSMYLDPHNARILIKPFCIDKTEIKKESIEKSDGTVTSFDFLKRLKKG